MAASVSASLPLSMLQALPLWGDNPVGLTEYAKNKETTRGCSLCGLSVVHGCTNAILHRAAACCTACAAPTLVRKRDKGRQQVYQWCARAQNTSHPPSLQLSLLRSHAGRLLLRRHMPPVEDSQAPSAGMP